MLFCPRCGQERVSEETSFCSRCGFLLTSVQELVETGGLVRPAPQGTGLSPRSRGIRQGLFMFLLTFVIAPIVGLISQFAFGIEPWPVGVVIFGLGIGGLLRIAYAQMFQSKQISTSEIDRSGPARRSEMQAGRPVNALPDRDARAWTPPTNSQLETEDLQPHSVTDSTTKLLDKEDKQHRN